MTTNDDFKWSMTIHLAADWHNVSASDLRTQRNTQCSPDSSSKPQRRDLAPKVWCISHMASMRQGNECLDHEAGSADSRSQLLPAQLENRHGMEPSYCGTHRG